VIVGQFMTGIDQASGASLMSKAVPAKPFRRPRQPSLRHSPHIFRVVEPVLGDVNNDSFQFKVRSSACLISDRSSASKVRAAKTSVRFIGNDEMDNHSESPGDPIEMVEAFRRASGWLCQRKRAPGKQREPYAERLPAIDGELALKDKFRPVQ